MSGKPPVAPPPSRMFPAVKANEELIKASLRAAHEAKTAAVKEAQQIEAVNKVVSIAASDPSIRAATNEMRNASTYLRGQAAAATDRITDLRQTLAQSPVLPTALTRRGVAGLFPATQVKKPMEGRGKTRRNKSSGGDIVTSLLTIRNQVKLYHWQTGSFARHKATDDLTAALDTNIDAFVESYMGKYGRPKVSGTIKLHNFSELAARGFVAQQTRYLSKELPRKISKDDTDLLNLRDTILGDLNKVLYLFTLA